MTKLSPAVTEELEHKLCIAEQEVEMSEACADTCEPEDTANWIATRDALQRVLAAGTVEALRAEPLAADELRNARQILKDNLGSDCNEPGDDRWYRRMIAKFDEALGENRSRTAGWR